VLIHQLLDNACRYTHHGQVIVQAFREQATVRINIRDTGPGIEPNLRDLLFTRFIRGSAGINSPERGIGLGLALARELIERQQGRVWLDQTSEQGSVFCVMIPCVQCEQPTEPIPAVEQQPVS
jgi:signal transduction histidine kinase